MSSPKLLGMWPLTMKAALVGLETDGGMTVGMAVEDATIAGMAVARIVPLTGVLTAVGSVVRRVPMHAPHVQKAARMPRLEAMSAVQRVRVLKRVERRRVLLKRAETTTVVEAVPVRVAGTDGVESVGPRVDRKAGGEPIAVMDAPLKRVRLRQRRLCRPSICWIRWQRLQRPMTSISRP